MRRPQRLRGRRASTRHPMPTSLLGRLWGPCIGNSLGRPTACYRVRRFGTEAFVEAAIPALEIFGNHSKQALGTQHGWPSATAMSPSVPSMRLRMPSSLCVWRTLMPLPPNTCCQRAVRRSSMQRAEPWPYDARRVVTMPYTRKHCLTCRI